MRDVEQASTLIAQKFKSDEFEIPPSRLSDIETRGVVPSVYRFYSLASVYRSDLIELLSLYGIEFSNVLPSDPGLSSPEK